MKRVTNFIANGNKVCAYKKFWKKEMGFGEEENNLFQKVFSSSPKKNSQSFIGSKLFAKVQMSFRLVGNRTCFSEKQ